MKKVLLIALIFCGCKKQQVEQEPSRTNGAYAVENVVVIETNRTLLDKAIKREQLPLQTFIITIPRHNGEPELAWVVKAKDRVWALASIHAAVWTEEEWREVTNTLATVKEYTSPKLQDCRH